VTTAAPPASTTDLDEAALNFREICSEAGLGATGLLSRMAATALQGDAE